jgi:hypothetical protein
MRGRLSRRPLQKQGGSAGGRYRKRAAGGRYRRPLQAAVMIQEQCPGAECPYIKNTVPAFVQKMRITRARGLAMGGYFYLRPFALHHKRFFSFFRALIRLTVRITYYSI